MFAAPPNEKTFNTKSLFKEDKLPLFGRYWPCKAKARAVILFVHGSGEHGERYRHVARFFNYHNFHCVSFDWRGHGRSDGERGFCPHLDAFFDDLNSIIKYIRETLEYKQKLVLYAHGTGCNICIADLFNPTPKIAKYDYIILSTPSICLKTRPHRIYFIGVRSLAKMAPHFRMPFEGNFANEYSNDPVIVEKYRQDPLVHDRWPARTICMFIEVGYVAEKNSVTFRTPVLIQHGEKDQYTPINTLEKWYTERTRGDDKEFKKWPHGMHELHNDKERVDVLNFVLEWLEKRLDSQKN